MDWCWVQAQCFCLNMIIIFHFFLNRREPGWESQELHNARKPAAFSPCHMEDFTGALFHFKVLISWVSELGRKLFWKATSVQSAYFLTVIYINGIFQSMANCFEISNGLTCIFFCLSCLLFLCSVLPHNDHVIEEKQHVRKRRSLCFLSLAHHTCRSVSALWKEGKQKDILLRHPSRQQNQSLILLAHGSVGNV